MTEQSKVSTTPKKDTIFDEKLVSFLRKIGTFKKKMLANKITRAKTECPRCGNTTLVLELKGTKNHIWMACRHAGCGFQLME